MRSTRLFCWNLLRWSFRTVSLLALVLFHWGHFDGPVFLPRMGIDAF